MAIVSKPVNVPTRPQQIGMANPAALAASQTGIQTRVLTTPQGQSGQVYVNGRWVDEWEWFRSQGKPRTLIDDRGMAMGGKRNPYTSMDIQVGGMMPVYNNIPTGVSGGYLKKVTTKTPSKSGGSAKKVWIVRQGGTTKLYPRTSKKFSLF